MSAYLQKYCTPAAAISHADILQGLAAFRQQSLHTKWTTLQEEDDSLHIQLTRNGCMLRLRMEGSLMYTDLMVQGGFQSIDLSFMGVPKHLSSQADLSNVLQQLEHAHRCAGASAACNGKYDSILCEKRSYVNQQGQVCGQQVTETILTKDGVFHSTVRSTACSQLVPQGELLCKPCKHLQRSQLDSTLRRAQDRQQADQKVSRARPQTETQEQAAKRAKEAQAQLRNSKKREDRLRQKVVDLQSEFQVVGKATDDDLQQLFEAAQKSDTSTGVPSLLCLLGFLLRIKALLSVIQMHHEVHTVGKMLCR